MDADFFTAPVPDQVPEVDVPVGQVLSDLNKALLGVYKTAVGYINFCLELLPDEFEKDPSKTIHDVPEIRGNLVSLARTALSAAAIMQQAVDEEEEVLLLFSERHIEALNYLEIKWPREIPPPSMMEAPPVLAVQDAVQQAPPQPVVQPPVVQPPVVQPQPPPMLLPLHSVQPRIRRRRRGQQQPPVANDDEAPPPREVHVCYGLIFILVTALAVAGIDYGVKWLMSNMDM